MAIQSFQQLQGLSIPELRLLHSNGDSRERVWVAWALALRLSSDQEAQAERALQSEPDPGVRRHLIVVLASRQEAALLEVLATEDPNVEVRATATQYLLQIGRLPVGSALHSRLATDEAVVIRLVIVGALADPGQLEAYYRDPNAEICVRAIDRMRELGRWRLTKSLEERAVVDPNPELRARLLQLCCEARCWPTRFAEASVAQVEEALHVWIKATATLPWSDLAPITRRKSPALDLLILRVIDPNDPDFEWTWACSCVGRARAAAFELAERSIAKHDVTTVPAALRLLLRELVEALREELTEYEDEDVADDDYEGGPGDQRRRLNARIERIMPLI